MTQSYSEDFVTTLDNAAKRQQGLQQNSGYDMSGDLADFVQSEPEDDYEYQRQKALALAMADEEQSENVKPTQGISRTIVDQGLQGVPIVGTFTDEVTDALGALIASTYLGYKKYAPNILGGESEKYADVAVSPLAQYDEARATTPERIKQQQEQNPLTSTASQIATGIGMPFGAWSAADKVPKLFKGSEYVGKGATAIDNWLRRGNTLTKVGKAAAAGIPAMALYGYGEGSGGVENRFKSAKELAPYGTIGAAIPVAGATYRGGKELARGAKEMLSPSIEKQTAELADIAINKYGIPLSRSQLGTSLANKGLAAVAERMPLAGGSKLYDKQQRAFNKAVAKSFGVDADILTGQTIKEGYKKTGELFDEALNGLSVKVDQPEIVDNLAKIQQEVNSSLSNDQAKIVNRQIDKFLEEADAKGWVSAEKLGNFRSQLTKTIERTSGDAKNYLKDLRDVVVDTSVAGDPERKAKLLDARMKYKNLKTIEDISAKAPDGNITPSLLLNPTKKSFKGTFARGGGSELEELARIGKQFLTQKIPNSGTPERLAAIGLLNPWTAPYAIPPMLTSAAFNLTNRNQGSVQKAIKKAIAGPQPSPLRLLMNKMKP